MKKFMCYLGIFLLIIIIITPPVLRKVYQNKEQEETKIVEKIIVKSISCKKEDSIVMYTYTNDKLGYFRITYNNNLELTEDTFIGKYFTKVHQIENKTESETIKENEVYTIDTVKIINLTLEEQTNLEEYTKSYDEMKTLLESNEFVCEETKMEN